jgi:hypothetical protein
METTYEDGLAMYLDIKKMRLVTENNVQIENYLYGEGTFSGIVTDPGSGLDIESDGDVILTSQMIGHGRHENWAAEDYACTIMFTNVTLDGTMGLAGGVSKTRFQSTVLNTTWDADYEKYSNNTIYYEYTLISTVANLDGYDSGSGYPENYPTIKQQGLHIEDALFFDTPRPRMYMGEDSIVLKSKHGVFLRITVVGEESSIISGKKYDCVDLRGDIIQGGEGEVEIRIIRAGDFTGITVYSNQDFHWHDEQIISEQVLKYINN